MVAATFPSAAARIFISESQLFYLRSRKIKELEKVSTVSVLLEPMIGKSYLIYSRDQDFPANPSHGPRV